MAAIVPDDILRFWFDTLKPRQWFLKDRALDAEIEQRFGAVLAAGGRCELWPWRACDKGRLAEIIVLDQFSRNIHRDTPQAFALDPLALALAQEAVAHGVDQRLEPARRAFLYMPYMHSESLTIHAEALKLFGQPRLEDNLKAERQHHAILQRFGRYPHRNATLGRISSAEERAFLATPGSSF